uniref:Predicted protein n=1 Tax=Hordeum vulgare subsp. vulgare TaxID=112509 RepID=F2DZV7_HORVV|nr:predicted protein [Hordeum vulgare subsp. vulgare]
MSFYGDCLGCYTGYYLKAGSCYLINTLCATFDYVNYVCSSCYNGYTLVNGNCV